MAVAGRRYSKRSMVHWYRGRRAQKAIKDVLAFSILTLGAILFIAPFFWMLSSALKRPEHVFNPNWIPKPVAWRNFTDALTSVPFHIYFKNSAIIAVISTAGTVLSASLVAYSFARLRWPGRDTWFAIILATMMLPGVVTMIPTYILFSRLHWVNTFLPLTVPAFFGGGAFNIFLLRQFFRTIPMELSEAARIDGASELRIWWQILMPLAQPALATVIIFAFNGAWQDYMGPLIYLSSEDKYTLQLGLTMFKAGGGGIPMWHWMMAASLVVMLPVLIVFFVGQKYFVEGVTLTGIKG
ncbi:MAG: carbohydrate ABC transporter permease [Anaerolineae bacterium]|nr:carbohydrate ABC transporter permease [Anaerolineae bacterium]